MPITLGHNQGLGDCILMNGAIRYLADRYGSARYLCVAKNFSFLNHIYRYDDNITPTLMSGRGKVTLHYKKRIAHCKRHRINHRIFNWGIMKNWTSDMVRIGLDPNINCWCEAFYKNLGVPYNHRYDSARFVRSLQREEDLFKKLNLSSDEPYIFVVDSRHRNKANYKLRYTDAYKIINPKHSSLWKTTHISDWMGVIENAKEVHTVDTSWFHLVKQMRLSTPRFYHKPPARIVPATTHNYVNDEWDNGWQIIDY